MKLLKKIRKLLQRCSHVQALRNELLLPLHKNALQNRARDDAADVKARLGDIVRRWPDQIGTSDARPIFIFAAGWRSGSTLVQRMLTSVDDVMIWGESYSRSQITGTLLNQFRSITMEWPFEYEVAGDFETELHDRWIANLYPNFDHLIRAHRRFYTELFAVPAQAMGRPRWGFKEVRLMSEHALYLKFLFPESKFVFLYRNPVDQYVSFRSYIKGDFTAWPDRAIVTVRDFGNMWCEMVADFAENHSSVGGILVKYEDLLNDPSVHRALCAYIEAEIPSPHALEVIEGFNRSSGARERRSKLSLSRDLAILERKVAPLLAQVTPEGSGA